MLTRSAHSMLLLRSWCSPLMDTSFLSGRNFFFFSGRSRLQTRVIFLRIGKPWLPKLYRLEWYSTGIDSRKVEITFSLPCTVEYGNIYLQISSYILIRESNVTAWAYLLMHTITWREPEVQQQHRSLLVEVIIVKKLNCLSFSQTMRSIYQAPHRELALINVKSKFCHFIYKGFKYWMFIFIYVMDIETSFLNSDFCAFQTLCSLGKTRPKQFLS